MFRAIYRRLSKRKPPSGREQGDGEPNPRNCQAQPETGTETDTGTDTDQDTGTDIDMGMDTEEMAPVVEVEKQGAVAATSSSSSSSSSFTSTIVASKSQQTVPSNPDQLKVLATRQQMATILTRLCDEAEGDSDTNQIVLEMLGSFEGGMLPSPSPIDRVSKQLLGVLRVQTLNDAGIAPGNEHYRCFESVVQNYTKIYAARKFMEQLPQLNQGEVLPQVAANQVLQIPVLLRQLWSSLDKMEFFHEDTAFKAYLEARHHPQAAILSELMLTRISRVFLCIVSSTMFLEFSEHELLHILRNCYLSVNSEIEVFLSMVLWMEHNWTEPDNSAEPDNCAERILAEVRFGLMPIWYLSTMARANRCQHFSRVISSPGVQRMIAQGLQDAITLNKKPRYSSATTNVTISTSTGTEETEAKEKPLLEENHLPRDWIVDIECRHHHKCHCRYFVYPTYDVFKSNLARIICRSPSYWHTFRPAQEVYRSDFRCCSSPYFP